MSSKSYQEKMELAIKVANSNRCITSPNPWVGCVIESVDGEIFTGATNEIESMHAEAVALRKAGEKAKGATAFVTLEPCSHFGKTSPCADSLIEAGIKKVIVGIIDPDEKVSGSGIDKLKEAGLQVEVGVCVSEIEEQLEPYIYHRRNKRPYVILKMAMTIDGSVTPGDSKKRYITSKESLEQVHKLRAQSDAILVGANTVRVDDPELNVRYYKDENGLSAELNPKRFVLGDVPSEAKVNPCETYQGDIEKLLVKLGDDGIIQLLIEGGPNVAKQFHDKHLINEYVFFISPEPSKQPGLGVFGGDPAKSFEIIDRSSIKLVERIGSDIKIVFRIDGN